jgi:hypothetical protein
MRPFHAGRTIAMRLPPLYKKLLALAAVIGPMFWLLLTEDGRRRTDMLMLWFFGEPQVSLALEQLRSDLGEAELRQVYPQLALVCEERESTFGRRSCKAPISGFNEIPAHYLAFFLTDGRLTALKAGYRSNYHDSMVAMTRRMLGAPVGSGDSPALSWPAGDGVALLPREAVADKDESALLWLGPALAAQRRAAP